MQRSQNNTHFKTHTQPEALVILTSQGITQAVSGWRPQKEADTEAFSSVLTCSELQVHGSIL